MTPPRAMRRLVLLNPNTDPVVTELMLSMARSYLPAEVSLIGMTAPFGSPLILDDAALATASRAMLSLVTDLRQSGCDGIVVAAFGDPALDELRRVLDCPVTGLAEASMARAARNGRRFCVVTTTPHLASAISGAVERYGYGPSFAGTFCTHGDPIGLMRDPTRLEDALLRVCEEVAAREAVEAIVIGGGPLAAAARALAGRVSVPLVEPVREAVLLAIERLAVPA
ncbi:aspartate/glutamate racemase family protein [Aureimonas sp. SA4125]|uniref:aspartate/glutamate racemase family protein n=1 Tax=Aureimonas sp. SA4125 TaxID=2826993 RepID=UPI001CC827E6|nr:aspartate/glutamate racemase family protein [Aureimonas sp. SA4125]